MSQQLRPLLVDPENFGFVVFGKVDFRPGCTIDDDIGPRCRENCLDVTEIANVEICSRQRDHLLLVTKAPQSVGRRTTKLTFCPCDEPPHGRLHSFMQQESRFMTSALFLQRILGVLE